MTPREKEIALEAAGRASDPVERAKKMLEAEAFLRGERPPFVVWPKKPGHWPGQQTEALSHEEKAAWHEAQAALARADAASLAEFMALEIGHPSEADQQDAKPESASIAPLLEAMREIIDRGEGARPPENPGVTLRELQASYGYRPRRLEVLTQVVSKELVGRPLRIALALLTCSGMSAAAIWLSLAALHAGAGK